MEDILSFVFFLFITHLAQLKLPTVLVARVYAFILRTSACALSLRGLSIGCSFFVMVLPQALDYNAFVSPPSIVD